MFIRSSGFCIKKTVRWYSIYHLFSSFPFLIFKILQQIFFLSFLFSFFQPSTKFHSMIFNCIYVQPIGDYWLVPNWRIHCGNSWWFSSTWSLVPRCFDGFKSNSFLKAMSFIDRRLVSWNWTSLESLKTKTELRLRNFCEAFPEKVIICKNSRDYRFLGAHTFPLSYFTYFRSRRNRMNLFVIADIFFFNASTGRVWFMESRHLDFIHFSRIAINPRNFKYIVETR